MAVIETRPVWPPVEVGSEAGARDDLRAQITRLETELAELVASGAPMPRAQARRRGPRLLSLAELERTRDELAQRAARMRRLLDVRGLEQEHARRQLEEVVLDPAQHRWTRVSREEIGEPGCGAWHARPRFGLLGMLMNWWRVKISSGCPLRWKYAAAGVSLGRCAGVPSSA